MGQSTNAILFYGINLGNAQESSDYEFDLDEYKQKLGIGSEDDAEFDYLYALRSAGLKPPDNDKYGEDWEKYWEEKRTINAASGCIVDVHCSCDYPYYYIAIKDSQKVAYRGSVVKIQNGLAAQADWDEKLKKFCEIMQLPYSEPGWMLVSYWG